MKNYLSSFVITSMIYTVLFSTFLYSFNDVTKINSQNKQSDEKVKITLIEKTQEQKIEPIIKKDIPKEIVKNQIKKLKPSPKKQTKIIKEKQKVVKKQLIKKKL